MRVFTCRHGLGHSRMLRDAGEASSATVSPLQSNDCMQFGRDERPLLATIAAHARLHLMSIADVAAALSRVAYTVQNSTLIAEQLRIVARAAAADDSLAAWLRLLEWFQESLQA
jgi:hypothetical protein